MTRLLKHALVALIVGSAVLGVLPKAEAAGRRDRKAPAVAIAAPTANSTQDGIIMVAGSSSDNVKVTRIAVGVDGGGFVTATGTTAWSLPVDSGAYADGTHAVTVKAWDAKGNIGKATTSVVFENGETAPPASGPSLLTTPEGTRIEVDSAGPWTAGQIATMLRANGLDSTVGPRLTVRVQDSFSSQVSTSTSKSGGLYTGFTAVMYLKGVNSTFAATPDATLAHELGHVWSLYHLYMSHQGDWSSYLEARDLDSDPRLDSAYEWGRSEIIADDYRLLFGTDEAIAQRPQHLNAGLPDPRDLAGLRSFLADAWE